MPGPFRFAPPKLGSHILVRPRLLRSLQDRWHHRATLVLGGAGFGKTTLLSQALSENVMARRGVDVWIGLDAADDEGHHLAGDLYAAITGTQPARAPSAQAVADACWQQAPTQICLVLDDGHHLTPESGGHRLVAELIKALPANGHVLVAARTDPKLPLARLAATGQLHRLTEPELAFDAAELRAIAAERDLDYDLLSATAGWPAMVELVATAGTAVAREFLWQEVIQPLPNERRRILAAVIYLGGADDELVSAALDTDVDLGNALAGVPLIAVSDEGWHRPHPLWHPMARLRLEGAERTEVHQRSVRCLLERARFDQAFGLIVAEASWTMLPELFRAACVTFTRHPPAASLRRWLAAVPQELSATPAVALASGVLASLDDPDHAAQPLQVAISGFRAADDVDGELGAITHLGRVAWWTGDLAILGELGPRIRELMKGGHPTAAALGAVGQAIIADLNGDDVGILNALTAVRPGQLGAAWEPALAWMRSVAHHGLGDLSAAEEITATAYAAMEDTTFKETLENQLDALNWMLGRNLDPRHDEQWLTGLRTRAVAGTRHNIAVAAASYAYQRAHLGDSRGAQELLDHVRTLPIGERPIAVVRRATAEAALSMANGNEQAAAQALTTSLTEHPLSGAARRAWKDALALTYVLVRDTRPTWEELPLRGTWSHARALAAAAAAVRDGDPLEGHLAALRLDDTDTIRVHLPCRLAAELAVGLHRAGRPQALTLLEALGTPGREHVRRVAESTRELAAPARALLRAVPAAPAERVRIAVLGPLIVQHGQRISDHPAWRRERVRALLTYLVLRGRATREEVIDALWPDFDLRAGTNNLRVTLNHLQAALEPGREGNELPYLVRAEGRQLRLLHDVHLSVDAADFGGHLAAAHEGERDGAPSVALQHYRAALELWRGEFGGDIKDADWLDLEQQRMRLAYLRALRRAAQLELARGEPDGAEALGLQAIAIDHYDEDAHGVLIGAALARGDRAAARRLLQQARDALTEIGVPPSGDLEILAARIDLPRTGR